jgi:hypothetical protein
MMGTGPQTLLTLGHESEGYLSTAQNAPALPTRPVQTKFGFTLEVHAPAEQPRFSVAPAAFGITAVAAQSPEDEARAFVEDLIQLGRVDFESAQGAVAMELVAPEGRSTSKQTHTLVPSGSGKFLLKRLHFNCGGSCCPRCS